jgi:hypothetical protein
MSKSPQRTAAGTQCGCADPLTSSRLPHRRREWGFRPINVIASEVKRSNPFFLGAARWIASSHPPSPEGGLRRTRELLAMTRWEFDSNFKEQVRVKQTFAISRRVSPEVCQQLAALSNQRARGGRAPDAPDSRVCNGRVVERTRVSQVTPESPGTPRAMVYAYTWSPRRSAFLPPSPAGLTAGLTSAPRCQDITTSSSASGALVRSAIRVHRIPAPRRYVAQRPSCWDGMAIDIARFVFLENRNVFPQGT